MPYWTIKEFSAFTDTQTFKYVTRKASSNQMSDSTAIIQELLMHSASLDSIEYKISSLQEIATKNNNSISNTMWIPLLSAIVGGLLVLIGQAIDRSKRKSDDRKESLLNIYAFCRKLESEMRNHYRELAMAKIHVEYWWHGSNQDGPGKERCYEEHLKSQAFAREVEKNIGQTKAVYISHVRKFQAIHPLKESVETQLEIISELTNSKAKSYDPSIPHHTVRWEMAERDEKELREIYFKNLDAFKTINDKLQVLVAQK